MLQNKQMIIDSIKKDDFNAFSKAVKQEMDYKIKNNSYVKKQIDTVQKYKSMEQVYRSLS